MSSFAGGPISSLDTTTTRVTLTFFGISSARDPSLDPETGPTVVRSPRPAIFATSVFNAHTQGVPSSRAAGRPSPPDSATAVSAPST